MSERYPPTERSKVRRLHERGSHDKAVLYPILDAGLLSQAEHRGVTTYVRRVAVFL